MEIPTPSDFLTECTSFCARHDMKPSRFSRDAAGHPSFLDSLEDGRSPGLEVANRVAKFMRAYDAAHPILSSGDPEPKNGRPGQGGFLARMVDAARGIAG